jgi:ferredoxin
VRDSFPKNFDNLDPNLYYFPKDDMSYLPMDRTVVIGEAIAKPEDAILPSNVLEYFIKNASHRCIMNFCICREAMKCKDYPIESGCIFLGDAAAKIHPDLGRQASVEETLEYAKRCREAGLIHLIGRDKLDILWLLVEPEDKLLTICNCCPCCCIHRVSPFMPGEAGKKVSKISGLSVEVTDKCILCGACVEEKVCIFNAIEIGDELVKINENECRACGRCADVCPEKAINVVIKDPKYIGKTIDRFLNNVDIR